ncbi:MAG: hypothetical protein WBG46_08000 [Nonlabens sp.]
MAPKIYKPGCVLIDNSGTWYLDFNFEGNSVEYVSKNELSEQKSLLLLDLLVIIDISDILSKKVIANNVQDSLEEAFPAIRKDDIYYDFQNLEQSKISILGRKRMAQLVSNNSKVFAAIKSIRLAPTLKSGTDNNLGKEKLYEIAMAYHIKEVSFSHNFQGILDDARNQTFNTRFFEFTKWSAIAILLIGLVVNFFYHEKYRSNLEEAKIITQTNKNLDAKIEVLQKQVDSDNILLAGNNTDDINIVRILNNLIVSHTNIQFTEVSFSPVKNKLSSDQDLRVEEGRVYISGKTNSEKKLNALIESFKEEQIVNDVSILSMDESKMNLAFELDIRLNEAK